MSPAERRLVILARESGIGDSEIVEALVDGSLRELVTGWEPRIPERSSRVRVCAVKIGPAWDDQAGEIEALEAEVRKV